MSFQLEFSDCQTATRARKTCFTSTYWVRFFNSWTCNALFSSSMVVASKKQWKKWQRQFDWLQGGPTCAKCRHCRDFESVIYQRSQLLQHEKSKVHRTAGACTCPSETEFGQMIDERFAGTSLRKSKLGPHKSLKMLWCTHEAIKDITKARVNRGLISASISQDGQGAGLGIRACLVTSERSLTQFKVVFHLANRCKPLCCVCTLCCPRRFAKKTYSN